MDATRIAYGPGPEQWGELYLPDAPAAQMSGVAVVIHGGYWRSNYGAELGAPLAKDLAAHGIAAWNLEYRRMGNGGGWPETFEDIAAGIDFLNEIPQKGNTLLDLSKVAILGHSAGGQLAVWAAARGQFRAGAVGADPAVEVTGVVSQGGLLDLSQAAELGLSDNAAQKFLGNQLALADPSQLLPDVPVYALHSKDDADVPYFQSQRYVERAQAKGRPATLVEVTGDHFALIDVSAEAYKRSRQLVGSLLQAE